MAHMYVRRYMPRLCDYDPNLGMTETMFPIPGPQSLGCWFKSLRV